MGSHGVGRAAQVRGISKIHLVGVEGAKSHWDNMCCHVVDNGFDAHQYTLLHGAVGTIDGIAEFPIVEDPAHDLGAHAVFSEKDRESGHRAVTEKVPCYSLPTLLNPYERVDVIHFDIQGHELEVISNSQAVLNKKAKRMVVGTHSRAIEEGLLHQLSVHGWILENAEFSTYDYQGYASVLTGDGCQIWRNSAFDLPDAKTWTPFMDILCRSLHAAEAQGRAAAAHFKGMQDLQDRPQDKGSQIDAYKLKLKQAKDAGRKAKDAARKAKLKLDEERAKYKNRWKRRIRRVLPFLRDPRD